MSGLQVQEATMWKSFFPSLVILLLGVTNTPARDGARAIIEKAIKAQGGEAKIAKLKVMKIKVKGKGTFPGIGKAEFVIEETWQMPAQYKSVMRVKDLEVIQAINGEKGWASVNGVILSFGKEDKAEFKEQKYAEDLERLGFLDDKRLTMIVVKETTFAEKSAVGVKFTAKGHRNVTLYFDKASGLLLGRRHVILEMGKEIVQEVSYGDFKDYNGLKHFTKITAKRNGKKVVEGEVVEIRFLEKLEDKEFAQP
jgi:hypothetical protein